MAITHQNSCIYTQVQQIEKIGQRELMCKRKNCNDIAFDTGKFIIF